MCHCDLEEATYWKEDPLWAFFSFGWILEQTFGWVQKPHQVDSSLFISQDQQWRLVRTLH